MARPAATADESSTGPATEKRFPPLIVPDGFRATLFACDPLVEYASVIALGPRLGTLFVAHDYLTGLGTEIVRRDEIRLISDSDGDGYADRSTLYAGEFNSIQGLAYHAGTVFVMHAPLLTALRDTDGDGAADERRDLLQGLGLPPEQNATRLHCANGVAVGHDGWLYLAMGDNGTNVKRSEGDRLVLNGGGILRCRADGRDLHVFSTGLRNIYDVALDEELNVFVRDNENDGGDYMIRVCHSFHSADHGYPYLYAERPDEALAPLADLGRGSSAGGVCYLETMFPADFRGNLFFCEWGRAVVRYRRAAAGSSFSNMAEHEFASGAPEDPYGFKPTDVVVDRDGSLLVSDWCDGQRPKRGRARIYRISYPATGQNSAAPLAVESGQTREQLVAQLDSPSYHVRLDAQLAIEALEDGRRMVEQSLSAGKLDPIGRMHAVWIVSRGERSTSLQALFEIAERDQDPRVRVQAIRAIGDLADPMLVSDRLETGRGEEAVAGRLAGLAVAADPRVQLAAVTVMGRLRWRETPDWLRQHLHASDPSLAHAALQALRRCDHWPGVLALLDEPDTSPIRTIALRAVAQQADRAIVDAILDRLAAANSPRQRLDLADVLTRVQRLPGEWTYWGYRPAPRPANKVLWERTEPIAAALDRVLADAEPEVRAATLRRMQREEIPVQVATLEKWLRTERDPERTELILESLAGRSPQSNGVFLALADIVRDRQHTEKNRRQALAMLTKTPTTDAPKVLLELAGDIEDGPVLVELLGALGDRPNLPSAGLIVGKLESQWPAVRAAAIGAGTRLGLRELAARIPGLMQDTDGVVRRAAATAAGELHVDDAVSQLLALSTSSDPQLCAASLTALRQLSVSTAVNSALGALGHAESQRAAMEYLAEFGGPQQLEPLIAAAATSRSFEILAATARAIDRWQGKVPTESSDFRRLDGALARLQADSGSLLRWRVVSALSAGQVSEFVSQPERLAASSGSAGTLLASGADAQVLLAPVSQPADGVERLVWTAVDLVEPARLQFVGASHLPWRIWINTKQVHKRSQPASFQPDSERFEVELAAGNAGIVIAVPASSEAGQFQLHFRRTSSTAEHERLARFVLQNNGDADRGREVFLDQEKSLCLKCHRLNGQGAAIGPDLTGIGRRFSRIHLIESILEPSRTIAPSYESVTIALVDGRVLTGVRVAETDETLKLGDNQGALHVIRKSEIEDRAVQSSSTMPEGLEKRLNDRELLNLVAFLLAQESPP